MKKEVRAIMKKVSDLSNELGVHPSELTKSSVIAHTDITDWDLRKIGGISGILKMFPITDKDLVSIKKLKDTSSYINKLEKIAASKLTQTDNIKEVLKDIKSVKVTAYKPKKREKISRELNLVLSDLHIGSDIHADETGRLDFGLKEESRRLARIVKETCGYKTEHRDSTRLNVLLLGDIIQNQLHDQRDGAPLAEQAARAIHLLSQAIAQFSANFRQVRILCNSGNHGRNTGRHHDRAVNQKWDSIETIVHYALKEACKGLKNVSFELPKTPYLVYEVFNKKVFATHGDTVLNPGYPGKAIRTGLLENQINRINATLKDTDEYSVFICGHVHVASVTHLSNGAIMVTNGSLVPVDEYAVSIGMMEVANGQYLFESVEDFPVGDTRYIRVSEADDSNSSLDKIIKPFTEL